MIYEVICRCTESVDVIDICYTFNYFDTRRHSTTSPSASPNTNQIVEFTIVSVGGGIDDEMKAEIDLTPVACNRTDV